MAATHAPGLRDRDKARLLTALQEGIVLDCFILQMFGSCAMQRCTFTSQAFQRRVDISEPGVPAASLKRSNFDRSVDFTENPEAIEAGFRDIAANNVGDKKSDSNNALT